MCTYKQPLHHSHSNLVFQVVRLATLLRLRSSTLLLEPFRSTVENLESWRTGSYTCIASTTGHSDGDSLADADVVTETRQPRQALAHC